jgi:hypothetical protein
MLIGQDTAIGKNEAIAAFPVAELPRHFSDRLGRQISSARGTHFHTCIE